MRRGLGEVVATRRSATGLTSGCPATAVEVVTSVESLGELEDATTTIDEEKNTIVGNDLGGNVEEGSDDLEGEGGIIASQSRGIETNGDEVDEP